MQRRVEQSSGIMFSLSLAIDCRLCAFSLSHLGIRGYIIPRECRCTESMRYNYILLGLERDRERISLLPILITE